MRINLRALLWLAVMVIIVATFVLPRARAQERGDTLLLVVPGGTSIAPGADGDMVIFIGKPMGGIDASNCAPEDTPRPLQTAIVVDRGSARGGATTVGIVTLRHNGAPQTTAVPNGTRVTNLVPLAGCTIGDASYDRYQGTVE
jgi:hypothetical protein